MAAAAVGAGSMVWVSRMTSTTVDVFRTGGGGAGVDTAASEAVVGVLLWWVFSG